MDDESGEGSANAGNDLGSELVFPFFGLGQDPETDQELCVIQRGTDSKGNQKWLGQRGGGSDRIDDLFGIKVFGGCGSVEGVDGFHGRSPLFGMIGFFWFIS